MASRPWVVFEDALRHPNLTLQNLTELHITKYVSDTLSANRGFRVLEKLEPESTVQLIADITAKASSVFLWVHLMVKSLLIGLSVGDRMTDLQKRVESLLSDLEALFFRILNSLDKEDLERASRIFQIVHAAKTPSSLLRLAYADELDEYVFKY